MWDGWVNEYLEGLLPKLAENFRSWDKSTAKIALFMQLYVNYISINFIYIKYKTMYIIKIHDVV